MAGMAELDIARVKRWCEARTPAELRDQMLVECDVAPRYLTIVECRPPWRASPGAEWTRQPIARLAWSGARGEWTLYWADRNDRFHVYDREPPSARVERLLDEIEADPTCIFWG